MDGWKKVLLKYSIIGVKYRADVGNMSTVFMIVASFVFEIVLSQAEKK